MNIEKMLSECRAHWEKTKPDAVFADYWVGWQASRESLVIELPEEVVKNAEKWKIVQRCMDMLQADERNASIWSACSLLLISTAHKLNSATSTVLEEGVTIGEEEVGDWRVTVERVSSNKEG